ncbi:MAG: hypothetical protein H7145_09930 [Akkermansiaceae bacterium]|nr:hypothetical protein [Armatimonadota bacterium]
MLFGLVRETHTATEEAGATLNSLYNRAGNLEKSLEAIAKREPMTLLTPEQIRTYNHVVEEAKKFLPSSVVLKEDAPIIEDGDLPHAETFFRVLHMSVVPTLHNVLTNDDAGAALPGV